jgi:hypothetical protein
MTLSQTLSVLLVTLCLACRGTLAFSPATSSKVSHYYTRLYETSSNEPAPSAVSEEDISEKVKQAAANYEEAPRMNPDRPELPELKGDFDWDAKFSGDDDWIVENVPGKVVLNELELAAQVTALGKLEEKWRKRRVEEEWEESRTLGWTAISEINNGRLAMFFLVVGLLTEYWTGFSLPDQVEEMLRVGGFIGFEG